MESEKLSDVLQRAKKSYGTDIVGYKNYMIGRLRQTLIDAGYLDEDDNGKVLDELIFGQHS